MLRQLEFDSLSLDAKYDYTWNFGTFLSYIKKDHQHVNLYWVDSFFAEVYFDNSLGKVIEIKSFNCVSKLSGYLQSIDIKKAVCKLKLLIISIDLTFCSELGLESYLGI